MADNKKTNDSTENKSKGAAAGATHNATPDPVQGRGADSAKPDKVDAGKRAADDPRYAARVQQQEKNDQRSSHDKDRA